MASNLRHEVAAPHPNTLAAKQQRTLPMLSETESASLVLNSYVMHITTQLCQHCSNGERFSQIFEVWTHPTHTRLSKFNKLLPLFGTKIDQTLPLASIELPSKPIPFCSDCLPSAMLLFGHTGATFDSRAAWRDTLQRKAQQDHTAEQRTATAKPAPTLDML